MVLKEFLSIFFLFNFYLLYLENGVILRTITGSRLVCVVNNPLRPLETQLLAKEKQDGTLGGPTFVEEKTRHVINIGHNKRDW